MSSPTYIQKGNSLWRLFKALGLSFDEYTQEHMGAMYNMYINDVIDETIDPLYIATYCRYVKKNYRMAGKYYKASIGGGNLDVAAKYCEMLMTNVRDYNNPNITTYLKIAMDNNNAQAYNLYAGFIEKTQPHNHADIHKYYKLAIELGNIDAYLYYSIFLYSKIGDIANAIIYTRAAYDKEHVLAPRLLHIVSPRPYLSDVKSFSIGANSINIPLYNKWRSERKYINASANECPICYEEPDILYYYGCLNHAYCMQCYKKLQRVKRCCAMCRQPESIEYEDVFLTNRPHI